MILNQARLQTLAGEVYFCCGSILDQRAACIVVGISWQCINEIGGVFMKLVGRDRARVRCC